MKIGIVILNLVFTSICFAAYENKSACTNQCRKGRSAPITPGKNLFTCFISGQIYWTFQLNEQKHSLLVTQVDPSSGQSVVAYKASEASWVEGKYYDVLRARNPGKSVMLLKLEGNIAEVVFSGIDVPFEGRAISESCIKH